MKNNRNHLVLIIALIFTVLQTYAQEEDLSDILEREDTPTVDYVTSTFKGTRIINGQSIEIRKKGTLEFLIMHRFGRLNSGAEELWGLDQSNIRLGLEYAVIDDLMVGIGRSSFQKTYDGFAKYKFLKQRSGKDAFPFSAVFFASAAYTQPPRFRQPTTPVSFSENLTYVSQLLIASKISSAVSLQLTPSVIHRNSIAIKADPRTIFAMGTSARVKLNNRLAISGEYFFQFNELESPVEEVRNMLALAVEIETGGHVFQIILSNTRTMIEKSFITETTGNFFKTDIHLGFNISRAFQVGNHGKRKMKK